MSKAQDRELPLGTTAAFAGMHKWLQRALLVCLTALVIEGTFTLPFLLVWFGWPQLTVTEVCHELMKVRDSDDSAECLIPHPLFSPSEGVAFKESAEDLWGIQPRPEYERIGWRGLLNNRDERLAREAAARQTNANTAAVSSQPPEATTVETNNE